MAKKENEPSLPAKDIQACYSCFQQTVLYDVLLFRSYIYNASRQTEFRLSPSLRLAVTSAAEVEKGAVCPADPPCKWEGAVAQWLLLITTKQLQTHRATAEGPSRTARPGDKPCSVGRPQAARCAPRYPRFTPTPWGPRYSPALLLPHQLLGLKLQGGRGIMSVNTTALTKKCHGPCSAGRRLWGGRYVCLDPCTPWQLLNSRPRQQRKIEDERNLQKGAGQTVLSDTIEAYSSIL